jgi:hypothetical protein
VIHISPHTFHYIIQLKKIPDSKPKKKSSINANSYHKYFDNFFNFAINLKFINVDENKSALICNFKVGGNNTVIKSFFYAR